jgi:hypothetical protein
MSDPCRGYVRRAQTASYGIINDALQTPSVYLGLFANDTCTYATDRKEGHVLRKLQRDLTDIETWCER